MTIFETTLEGPICLQKLYRAYTLPPTSVEAERTFSSAGLFITKLRTSLNDTSDDCLCFWRKYLINLKKDQNGDWSSSPIMYSNDSFYFFKEVHLSSHFFKDIPLSFEQDRQITNASQDGNRKEYKRISLANQQRLLRENQLLATS